MKTFLRRIIIVGILFFMMAFVYVLSSNGSIDRKAWMIGLYIMLAGLVLMLIIEMFIWWRSFHSYCGECGARNKIDANFCRRCGNRLIISVLTPKQRAWLTKFNWRRNPFTLDVIPDIYVGHQDEISSIVEKLKSRSGHVLVLGGTGMGKTALLRWLERNLAGDFSPVYVVRPTPECEELIELVLANITDRSNGKNIGGLQDFQKICSEYQGIIVVLLDEAQELSEEFEKCLKTMGDCTNVLLVMAGLPPAQAKLKKELPGLFDRVVEQVLLSALNSEEVAELIEKRVARVGGEGLGPFTKTAIEMIYDVSFGVPREVIKVCDWTVTQAIKNNKDKIDANDVRLYRKG